MKNLKQILKNICTSLFFIFSTPQDLVASDEVKTIGKIIDDYVSFLKMYDEIIELEEFISKPLNTRKALESELKKTEIEFSFSLPAELRDYYLNESNGTESNINEYPTYYERLDIFSHQKIVGIEDFFKMYWKNLGDDISVLYEGLSEEDMQFINNNNREFFVFAADWSENFIRTFVFDRKNNFYGFYFDQDEHISYYINEMINGSNHVAKSKSFVGLLNEYLEQKKIELKKDFK